MSITARKFARIEQAAEALGEGRVLVVVDSEDRENEGDFLAAAEKVTPEIIHFMAGEGRGQICVPVSPSIAQRLSLRPMVPATHADLPRFTVSVDWRGCGTGISPVDRARTIQAMVDPSSRSEDFLRPGHVFPLIARPRGVLERTGHTEAAVDLARMAGLAEAGVLCEICSRDGRSMARREELLLIAAAFDLLVVTIDDLFEYRRENAPATA